MKKRRRDGVRVVHISSAPSVEQIRQRLSSSYLCVLCVCTPLGLILSRNTISLFDRNAAALAVLPVQLLYLFIKAHLMFYVNVGLIVSRGQEGVNMFKSVCVFYMSVMCVSACVCVAAVVAALPLTNGLIRTGAVHMCSSWAVYQTLCSH